MVYFSGIYTKRTPRQRLIRKIIGICTVAIIIYLLSLIPYEILREERYRMYGETRTTGLVTEMGTHTASDGNRSFTIAYKYIDQDGLARMSTAQLPRKLWDRFSPGNRLDVFYVSSQPKLSRVLGEIEPAFQTWLRDVLQ